MRKLIDAYQGAFLYHKIVSGKKQVFFLILADDDDELNYYALAHVREYAEIASFSSVEVICAHSLASQIQTLNKQQFPVSFLSTHKMQLLTSYLLLKTDAIGVSILSDCVLISLKMHHEGLFPLYASGFFDKEYLVWYKMLFHALNFPKPLKRTVPFSEKFLQSERKKI